MEPPAKRRCLSPIEPRQLAIEQPHNVEPVFHHDVPQLTMHNDAAPQAAVLTGPMVSSHPSSTFLPEPAASLGPPDHDLLAKRAEVEHRLQTTMERIFEKYSRDFEGIGDEIDMYTGKIVVNNGHLKNLPKNKKKHEPGVSLSYVGDDEDDLDDFIVDDEEEYEDEPDDEKERNKSAVPNPRYAPFRRGALLPRSPPNQVVASHADFDKLPRFPASSPVVGPGPSPIGAWRLREPMSSPVAWDGFATPTRPRRVEGGSGGSGTIRRGILMRSPFEKGLIRRLNFKEPSPSRLNWRQTEQRGKASLGNDVNAERIEKKTRNKGGRPRKNRVNLIQDPNLDVDSQETHPRTGLLTDLDEVHGGTIIDTSDEEEENDAWDEWLSSIKLQDASLLAAVEQGEESATEDDALHRRRSGRARKPPEYLGKVTWIEALENLAAAPSSRREAGQSAQDDMANTYSLSTFALLPEAHHLQASEPDQRPMRKVIPDSQDSATPPASSIPSQSQPRHKATGNWGYLTGDKDSALVLSDEEAPVVLRKTKTVQLEDRQAQGQAQRSSTSHINAPTTQDPGQPSTAVVRKRRGRPRNADRLPAPPEIQLDSGYASAQKPSSVNLSAGKRSSGDDLIPRVVELEDSEEPGASLLSSDPPPAVRVKRPYKKRAPKTNPDGSNDPDPTQLVRVRRSYKRRTPKINPDGSVENGSTEPARVKRPYKRRVPTTVPEGLEGSEVTQLPRVKRPYKRRKPLNQAEGSNPADPAEPARTKRPYRRRIPKTLSEGLGKADQQPEGPSEEVLSTSLNTTAVQGVPASREVNSEGPAAETEPAVVSVPVSGPATVATITTVDTQTAESTLYDQPERTIDPTSNKQSESSSELGQAMEKAEVGFLEEQPTSIGEGLSNHAVAVEENPASSPAHARGKIQDGGSAQTGKVREAQYQPAPAPAPVSDEAVSAEPVDVLSDPAPAMLPSPAESNFKETMPSRKTMEAVPIRQKSPVKPKHPSLQLAASASKPHTPRRASLKSISKPVSSRRSLLSLLSHEGTPGKTGSSNTTNNDDDDDEEDELGRVDDTIMSIPRSAPGNSSSKRTSLASATAKRRIWKSSALTREVQRTPVKQRSKPDVDVPGSPVLTPGGTVRVCGVDSYHCGRDFCFTCL